MTKKIFSLFLLLLFLTINSLAAENTGSDDMKELLTKIRTEFSKLRPQVIKPAKGYFKHPYLIPGGFYTQMWDWDGFFMGNHFVSINKPEYLKYWSLIFLEGIDSKGYVSGGATIKGQRKVFGKFAMKPFLSQGVYIASEALKDYSWVKKHYKALKRIIKYREATQLDKKYGLFYWDNAMQSGADNNPAMNYYKDDRRSFLAPDVCTFQLREYIAQSRIAEKLGYKEDAVNYSKKAAALKKRMNELLWDKKDKIYYTADRETGKLYKRVSYSSFIPLIQRVPSEADGKEMIKRYLINPDHMKAEYGLRSLSAKDPDYNNKNIIVPFSNWQGPVWPVANYIYAIGLKHYGFDKELRWLAETLGQLMLKDIKKWETMHENYHADTGAPLAPSADHVDKNGKFVGFISWNLCIQNLLEGVVENRWMLIEIK